MLAESEKGLWSARKIRFTWGIRLVIAAAGAAVSWWWSLYWLNHANFLGASTPSKRIIQTSPLILGQLIALVFTVWAIVLFFDGLRRSGKVGTLVGLFFGLSFTALVSHALLSDWFKHANGNFLHWLFWVGPVAVILLYPLPIMRMKRRAMNLATQGDYEGALRISKLWLRSKVYGRPFRGWIMLQAGRYTEALDLLREGAFDDKGRPLLTSANFYLYFYVLTLMGLERYVEAQELLEAATRVGQKRGYYKFSLAECLLSQGKDPDRARELIEQVISNLKKPSASKEPVSMAHCVALRAWALASDGHSREAESILEEAFSESATFGKDDLAGLIELKGCTCLALGDKQKAREAFQQALALFPYGSIAKFAQKKLSELDETAL